MWIDAPTSLLFSLSSGTVESLFRVLIFVSLSPYSICFLRNSIALSTDRIIIKSSPGAAVYPDQLPRVAAAPVLSLLVNCFNE